MQFAVGTLFSVQRIVHIFGAGAVDGDKLQRGKIATRQTFVLHLGCHAVRRFFFKIVACQRNPPWHEMIGAKGNELGQFRIKTAIAFQRMTAHFCYGPVTFFKIMLNATGGAAGNGIFQQRVIRHDRKTIVFSLHLTHKTGQERFDQFFRLGGLTFLFGMNDGHDAVAMHHFLHLRWRNEVAFLRVNFKEAKALFRGFYDPFCTRRLGMQLLFKLR